jgi:hypothetical protein
VKLDKNGFIWLVPKFINSGQSPALKIRVRYSVSLLHIATSAITKEEGKWTGWNETVPPGIEEYEGVAWHCPRQINDVLIQAWGEKGALVLTVRAEISSRDVFDIKFPISASFVSFVDHWDGGEFYRLGDANTAVAAFRGELAGRRGSD